jgi:hypothetical protein
MLAKPQQAAPVSQQVISGTGAASWCRAAALADGTFSPLRAA